MKNIFLFACAAAAESAGFRPCKRCHPQAAPGTPAWLGTSAVVSRGLRLILEGALDEGSVDTLAERLGLGSRQLHRLFVQHLGASPLKIAIAHRVDVARRLIDSTEFPMTQIAMHSGFNSVREFNHAVRRSTEESPSELRRAANASQPASRSSGLEIHLSYRKPFDWASLVAFLEPRAIPGVEVVTEQTYQRTIEIAGAPGFLTVRPDDASSRLVIRIETSRYDGLPLAVQRIRRMFDLNASPKQIALHLSRDPKLRRLLKLRPGLRVPGAWDGFEAAVLAVLGQKLTTPGPKRTVARLVRTFGTPLDASIAGLQYLFPRPEVLAAADLSKAGISDVSAMILRKLAASMMRRYRAFATESDLDQAAFQLRTICEIDESTANYIAMRACGEPDAFPSNELQLRRRLAGLNPVMCPAEAVVMAERWRPWRAYAAMHLAQ